MEDHVEAENAIAERVRRFSRRLQRRIRAGGLSQREVERRLGWNSGYVSQLLRGNQDLKIKHALAILDTVGEGLGTFVADLAVADRGEGLDLLPTSTGDSEASSSAGMEDLLRVLRPYVRDIVLDTLRNRT